jgi:acetolactate synthase I/III small subunit
MVKKQDDHTYTLSLTVRNRPGVLVRCAQVFGRRGHNIEALHVAAIPDHEDASRMTITAFGKPEVIHQITAQLAKLVDVLDVKEKEIA